MPARTPIPCYGRGVVCQRQINPHKSGMPAVPATEGSRPARGVPPLKVMIGFLTFLFAAFLVPFESPAQENDRQRMSTAVGLNYCRAAFHRIQKMPSKRVLFEEQEKILNNLNLNEIADEEVVRLYTAVLQEISEIRLAGKERMVIEEQYKRALTNSLVMNSFDFGTQLATSQYLAAVRTGARSWWDYRNLDMKRDVDQFRVEKDRMIAIVDKSSHFLDTFWKLARKRTIPDRWLIRGQDLDRLHLAMQEPDLTVRLRVLKRMEEFMECYPPYWYYVARTQQGLGQLFAAAETYERLASVGNGHFRKDEMLAAGLANRAVIQEYLHQPGALESARLALGYSTDVWEANLMCARVLGAHGDLAAAEDAILRNLDVGLEREYSMAALVSLHSYNRNVPKLMPLLNEPSVVRLVPIPTLVQCAALIGSERLPRPAAAQLANSLTAVYDLRFGRDDLLLTALPTWQFQDVPMQLVFNSQTYGQPEITNTPTRTQVRFRNIAELGHPLQTVPDRGETILTVTYSDANTLQLRLKPSYDPNASMPVSYTNDATAGRRNTLHVAEIVSNGTVIALRSPRGEAGSASSQSGSEYTSGSAREPARTPESRSNSAQPVERTDNSDAEEAELPATSDDQPSTSPVDGDSTTPNSDTGDSKSRYVPPLPANPADFPSSRR